MHVKPWTVMVFMKVDFLSDSYATASLRKMMRIGSNGSLNIVVQIERDWVGQPERLLIHRRRTHSFGHFGPVRVRRNSGADVTEFLDWTHARFPAQRYLLVLRGHSYGFGFGRYPHTWLTIPELARALRRFKSVRRRNLDLLGFSACTTSHAEAAYELHDAVDFMVAPQVDIPSRGWPYDSILRDIQRNPAIHTPELSARIVAHFVGSYRRRNVALTAMNLAHGPTLAARLQGLVSALNAARRSRAHRQSIDEAFSSAASEKRVRPLIDLFDLCTNLRERVQDESVRAAAGGTLRLLRQRFLLLAHASRGPRLRKLRGIGIYAPHVTSRGDWRSLKVKPEQYRALRLMRTTRWAQLVRRLGKVDLVSAIR